MNNLERAGVLAIGVLVILGGSAFDASQDSPTFINVGSPYVAAGGCFWINTHYIGEKGSYPTCEWVPIRVDKDGYVLARP